MNEACTVYFEPVHGHLNSQMYCICNLWFLVCNALTILCNDSE